MKIRKKFAAMLLSVCMVLTLLPAGALAVTNSVFQSKTADGQITVQNTNGQTRTKSSYSAYQIAAFDYDANANEYVNGTVNSIYKGTLISAINNINKGSTQLDAAKCTDNDILTALSKITTQSSDIATLADALETPALTDPVTKPSTNGVISGLNYGYYLVNETANSEDDGSVISKPILVGVPGTLGTYPSNKEVTVKTKTSKAGITKKIVVNPGASNEALVDTSTAAFGDLVTYQANSDIPTYPTNAAGITYEVTDTFSKGLVFKDSGILSVMVVDPTNKVQPIDLTKNNSAYSYTIVTDPTSKETTFDLKLKNDSDIKDWGNKGYQLVIRYAASLVGDVTYGSTGNPNSVHLTYSVKPGDSTSFYKTPDDTVITYVNILTINKTDDSGKALNGAGFTLSKKDTSGNWVKVGDEITTGASGTDGQAQFTKLYTGIDYQLEETTVPAGYSKAPNVTFTLKAQNTNDGGSPIDIYNSTIDVNSTKYSGNTNALNFKANWLNTDPTNSIQFDHSGKAGVDGSMSVDIKDYKGFVLPGTGGIGTTIFFVSGIAILLLGGCLAFVYTRKKRTGSHFQH